MNIKSRKGFSLVELLVVVAILVIVAGSVISLVTNAPDQARKQFTTETMIKLKPALLDFRDDLGDFPNDGVMIPNVSRPEAQTGGVAQGIDIRLSLNPPGSTTTYPIGSIADPSNGSGNENAHFSWSDNQVIAAAAPATTERITSNFWMLFQRPYPKDWGDYELADGSDFTYRLNFYRFDKTLKLGWEGPYVKDDRGGLFFPEGSTLGNQFAVPDEYIAGPYSESWFKEDTGNGVDSRRILLGSPILFIKDIGDPDNNIPAKGYYLLSAGPNGIYDFTVGSDDIEVFVSPLLR